MMWRIWKCGELATWRGTSWRFAIVELSVPVWLIVTWLKPNAQRKTETELKCSVQFSFLLCAGLNSGELVVVASSELAVRWVGYGAVNRALLVATSNVHIDEPPRRGHCKRYRATRPESMLLLLDSTHRRPCWTYL